MIMSLILSRSICVLYDIEFSIRMGYDDPKNWSSVYDCFAVREKKHNSTKSHSAGNERFRTPIAECHSNGIYVSPEHRLQCPLRSGMYL